MKFPDFQEFADELKTQSDELFAKELKATSDPSNIKELAGVVLTTNATFTLNALRSYHQWLSRHFEENQ